MLPYPYDVIYSIMAALMSAGMVCIYHFVYWKNRARMPLLELVTTFLVSVCCGLVWPITLVGVLWQMLLGLAQMYDDIRPR